MGEKVEASTVGVFTVYFQKSRTDTAHPYGIPYFAGSLAMTTFKSCVRIEKSSMPCGLDVMGDEAHGDVGEKTTIWNYLWIRKLLRSFARRKKVPGRRSK